MTTSAASISFGRLATVEASTKRRPATSGGRQSSPVENITSLYITPLAPVDAEMAARLGLNSPAETMQAFTWDAADVAEGDVLTVSGVDYPVRFVGRWDGPGGPVRHLVVERLVR